jgi:hypothetical protein
MNVCKLKEDIQPVSLLYLEPATTKKEAVFCNFDVTYIPSYLHPPPPILPLMEEDH